MHSTKKSISTQISYQNWNWIFIENLYQLLTRKHNPQQPIISFYHQSTSNITSFQNLSDIQFKSSQLPLHHSPFHYIPCHRKTFDGWAAMGMQQWVFHYFTKNGFTTYFFIAQLFTTHLFTAYFSSHTFSPHTVSRVRDNGCSPLHHTPCHHTPF